MGSGPIIGGSIFPVVEYVTSGDGMNVLRSDSVAETNTKSYLPLKNIRCVARQTNRQQEINDIDQRGLVILPFTKGFSERVIKVLRGLNIEVPHRPIRSISSILKKPKDKIEKGSFRGIVYQIKWKGCDFVYVGQTSLSLKTHVKNTQRP